MKIKKVLNNNAVTALDEQNQELVVMGLGIAFKKKTGDRLDEKKIERIFSLQDQISSNKLEALINQIPSEFLDLTEKIVRYAEHSIGQNLSNSIYLTLTDHIYFAIERFNDGLLIENPLVWEVKKFYKEAFIMGEMALEMIKEQFNITLPNDEAASIALHIVNAQLGQNMAATISMTKLIQDILNIIKYQFSIEMDEDDLSIQRLITDLKFYIIRIQSGQTYTDGDQELFDIISEKYARAYTCTEKIDHFLFNMLRTHLTKDEKMYLTIHIQKLLNQKNIKIIQ